MRRRARIVLADGAMDEPRDGAEPRSAGGVLRGDGSKVLLFRAANLSNERVWEFDRDFAEKELQEAGVIMSRALLPLHRALLASGVVLMVHTDWGRRESYAMRYGVHALTQESTQSAGGNAARRVDEWILRNMLMHVALSLDHVLQKLLPAQIGLIERRWPRAVELLEGLPTESG